MNERGRDILIRAASAGLPQIKNMDRNGYGGFSAGGLLLADAEARGIKFPRRGRRLFWNVMNQEYGIASLRDWLAIADANDSGATFLAIAHQFA